MGRDAYVRTNCNFPYNKIRNFATFFRPKRNYVCEYCTLYFRILDSNLFSSLECCMLWRKKCLNWKWVSAIHHGSRHPHPMCPKRWLLMLPSTWPAHSTDGKPKVYVWASVGATKMLTGNAYLQACCSYDGLSSLILCYPWHLRRFFPIQIDCVHCQSFFGPNFCF